jgi:hypothetical protein
MRQALSKAGCCNHNGARRAHMVPAVRNDPQLDVRLKRGIL